MEPVDHPHPEATPPRDLSRESIDAIVDGVRRRVLDDLLDAGLVPSGDLELAARWERGELVLRPSNPDLQEKVVPLETFFHKLVMVRERLRVLEQKINNHPKLGDPDRVELQQYITQIYGSFTSFNILFDNRIDGFVGQSRDR